MKPYKRVTNKFNPDTPLIKQIFCIHDYKGERENMDWVRCYFMKCQKCGKLKDIYYYSNKRW